MKNTVSFLSRTFTNDRLKNITAAIDTALNGRSLDVDTMQVELTTGPMHLGLWSNDPFPLYDVNGLRLFSSEQTAFGAWDREDALVLRRGGSQYAIVYPDSVTRTGEMSYRVSCTSALGKLAQMGHKGGIYDSTSQTKAGPLLREICGYVNGRPAAGVTIYVAPEYEDQHIYGWLPYLSPTGEAGAQAGSARDNLLQVLFAINGSLRDDANGTLRVETLSVEPSSSITADRIYRNNAQVVEEQPITEVTVLEHAYVVGNETRTLFDGTTSEGQIIVFSEPMANLSAVGFSIMESGANYAVLSAGSGTLTGTPYVDTTREITRTVSAAAVPNTERVEKATLVSIVNSSAVANRLAAYYACRKWIECDAVIDYEDAGDVVNIWDPFDKVMRQACIEKISPLKVSNVMQGRVSALIGFTPWQTEVFDDEYELLTGSGTWSVPEGVSEIEAVLIGAGSNGAAGSSGGGSAATIGGYQEAHTDYTTDGASASVSTSKSTTGSSSAGRGGAGGAGGSGGKILRVSIDVQNINAIAFSCGASAASPATTFGSYSSANGASSPGGYYDLVSGVTFGKKGADGEAGGNGGSGGGSGGATSSARGGYGISDGSHTYSVQDYILNPRKKEQASVSASSAGGGGAGGSSGTTAGSAGGNAGRTSPSGKAEISSDSSSVTGRATGYAAYGGNGGNGANGANATVYGCGGGGGGGGGGAGANGSVTVNGTISGKVDIGYGWNYERWSHYASVTGAASKIGGTGGTGGTGAPGCVILIYRRPA